MFSGGRQENTQERGARKPFIFAGKLNLLRRDERDVVVDIEWELNLTRLLEGWKGERREEERGEEIEGELERESEKEREKERNCE